MIQITYTIVCHCGGEATSTTLDSTAEQPDGSLRIDVELAVTQTTFECPDCGCSTATGDLDLTRIQTECPGPTTDDEEVTVDA